MKIKPEIEVFDDAEHCNAGWYIADDQALDNFNGEYDKQSEKAERMSAELESIKCPKMFIDWEGELFGGADPDVGCMDVCLIYGERLLFCEKIKVDSEKEIYLLKIKKCDQCKADYLKAKRHNHV